MAEPLKIYAIGEEGLQNIARSVSPVTGDGGGTGSGPFEPRIAKLESDVGHIQSDITEIKRDIRLLVGAVIGSFLILAGMFCWGYLDLNSKIDRLPEAVVAALRIVSGN